MAPHLRLLPDKGPYCSPPRRSKAGRDRNRQERHWRHLSNKKPKKIKAFSFSINQNSIFKKNSINLPGLKNKMRNVEKVINLPKWDAPKNINWNYNKCKTQSISLFVKLSKRNIWNKCQKWKLENWEIKKRLHFRKPSSILLFFQHEFKVFLNVFFLKKCNFENTEDRTYVNV